MAGYIYLVREREYLRAKEEVTKAGRTGDIIRRMKEYPKGSRLLFCMMCDDYKRAETEILAMLGRLYKPRRDVGTESFEGDTKGMVAAYITARSISGPALKVEQEQECDDDDDIRIGRFGPGSAHVYTFFSLLIETRWNRFPELWLP